MKTLRIRLTCLYTMTTGAILLLVMVSLLLFSVRDSQKDRLEQFQVIWSSLNSRFLASGALSHGYLAETEAGHHMIIHISENGIPFLYRGSWNPDTDRLTLIDRALKQAEDQGVFTDQAPVSSGINTTSLMVIEGDQGDRYYAMVSAASTKNGVKGLCAVSLIPPVLESMKETFLLMGVLSVLGAGCLWFISWQFVGWSLKPVEESQKKQARFIAAASQDRKSVV